MRAAALLAVAVLACGCKPKSISQNNRTTLEKIQAIKALEKAAKPPEMSLPDLGVPHIDTVPARTLPSRRTGPLYLENLPSSARPPHGPPRLPSPEQAHDPAS